MTKLAEWDSVDEKEFVALLSPEARTRLAGKPAWNGVERRSKFHQSTRALVGDLLRKHPKWPAAAR